MANEKIDVKAEAERIIESPRVNTPCGKCDEQVAEIIDLASSVRDEAIRETVKRCIEIVKQQFAAGRRPEIERVLRQAFAEPGNCSESPNGSPDTLRQCVESFAAGMLAKLTTKKNRAKGDRAGWLSMTADQLHRRLLQEVVELTDAVGSMESVLAIETEAHDVANFAMMIADKTRFEMMGEPKPTERKPATLRQFVDAAVELARAVGEPLRDGYGIMVRSRDTILRLAPQFKEPTP